MKNATKNVLILLFTCLAVSLYAQFWTETVGFGEDSNATHEAAPVNIWYRSIRTQSVYTVTELNQAGIYGPGEISGLSYYITGVPEYELPHFSIRIKHTEENNAGSHDDDPFEFEYIQSSFMPASDEWNEFTFTDSTFYWDGEDNLLIDITFDLVTSYSPSGQMLVYPFERGMRYVRSDESNQSEATTLARADYKPQMKLLFQPDEFYENDMAALTVNGPKNMVADNEYTHQVTVMNVGTAPQDAYTVHLMKTGNEILASIDADINLEQNESATFDLSWIPESSGTYNIWGMVELDNDENSENVNTATMGVTVLASELFAGGSGTADNPYIIDTFYHFVNIDNHRGKHFILNYDIDLFITDADNVVLWDDTEDYEFGDLVKYEHNQIMRTFICIQQPDANQPPTNSAYWKELWYSDNGWSPFRLFTGSLDGNGYTISNLHIDRPDDDNVGLFSRTEDALIKNLTLSGVNIIGNESVGAFVGRSVNTTIENCHVTGSIDGFERIGGLVGYQSSSKVKECSANVSVTGEWYIGGIIGYTNYHSSITECNANVDNSGIGSIGGLIGYNNHFIAITNSYATGTVHASENSAAGLIAYSHNTSIANSSSEVEVHGGDKTGGLIGFSLLAQLYNCHASGNVEGDNNVGGLIGYSLTSDTYNCYSLVDVEGVNNVGGLFGTHTEGSATNSYSTGQVMGTGNFVGGLIGYNDRGIISDCYWNTETSGQTLSAGGEGRTTDEMTYPYADNTYVGWNFDSIWIEDEDHSINDGYPYLMNLPVRVALPTFSPEPKAYTDPVEVTIRTKTQGAKIYYTIDGSDPDENSFEYTGPINVGRTMTIKARAYIDNWIASEVATAHYIITSTSTDEPLVTQPTKLYGAYPNPFNPDTTIRFSLQSDSEVSLNIYNIRGQKVHTLVSDYLEQGEHEVVWNGRNDSDRQVASGIYLYKLKTPDHTAAKKMMLLK
jgi:hypothetical protein